MLSFFLITCAPTRTETKYYLIDYSAPSSKDNKVVESVLPYKAQVSTLKIPRSFDSIRIIARFSSHQINYYRYSLWAVKPQIVIADLLAQHINAYNLFEKCQREYLEERPDFDISGEIMQIERFDSENYTAAHLRMAFEIHSIKNGQLLVHHEFDVTIPITADQDRTMSLFAKAISDIVQRQTDLFIVKIADYFKTALPDDLKVEDETTD